MRGRGRGKREREREKERERERERKGGGWKEGRRGGRNAQRRESETHIGKKEARGK